jgi:hypothetical protein
MPLKGHKRTRSEISKLEASNQIVTLGRIVPPPPIDTDLLPDVFKKFTITTSKLKPQSFHSQPNDPLACADPHPSTKSAGASSTDVAPKQYTAADLETQNTRGEQDSLKRTMVSAPDVPSDFSHIVSPDFTRPPKISRSESLQSQKSSGSLGTPGSIRRPDTPFPLEPRTDVPLPPAYDFLENLSFNSELNQLFTQVNEWLKEGEISLSGAAEE